jgi:hypothetical protein
MAGTVLAKLDRMPNDNAARILVADDKPVLRRLVQRSRIAGGVPKASQLQPVSTRTTGEGHGSANTSASQDAHHRLRTSQDDMQVHLTWRADLLNDIVKVAAIAGVLLTAMVIAFRSPPRFDISTYLVMSASLLMLVLRFLPRLPFRLRAGLAIAAIYGSGLPTILRSGFALSSAAVLLSSWRSSCWGVVRPPCSWWSPRRSSARSPWRPSAAISSRSPSTRIREFPATGSEWRSASIWWPPRS